MKLERPASDKEIAAELGIDEEELSKLLRDLAATTIISLDDL